MLRHIPRHFFSSSTPVYDLIISGAGPAGASLACALSLSPLFSSNNPSILLLDHLKGDSMKDLRVEECMKNIIGDHRVVTLTPGSMRFIDSLNISSIYEPKRITKVHKMQVWESISDGYFVIDSEKEGKKEVLAHTWEIKHLQAALMEKIRELGKVKLGVPDTIEEIDYSHEKEVRVKLKEGGWVASKLVVGSDGKNSKVKQAANIPTYGWSYSQMGIVCTIQAGQQPVPTAFQRYLPNGLIALLPLWEDYYSIVWTVNLEEFDYLSKLDDVEFIKELNKILTISPTKPSSFPPIPGIIVDAANGIANGALTIMDSLLGRKNECIKQK
jgi:2-polyprenyl-6-methoxyphenol hydroxylase-like FAD-dependent oxidoreductase